VTGKPVFEKGVILIDDRSNLPDDPFFILLLHLDRRRENGIAGKVYRLGLEVPVINRTAARLEFDQIIVLFLGDFFEVAGTEELDIEKAGDCEYKKGDG
jgi:hypothetical protein